MMNYSKTIREYCLNNPGMVFDMSYVHSNHLKWCLTKHFARYYLGWKMKEYCSWHATGKWKGIIFQVDDMSKEYYAYDFKNPRRLAKPIKIIKTGRVWTKIDDGLEMNVQERLFFCSNY